MKNSIKTLALCGGILTLEVSAQAQTTINGWGIESGSAGGTTLVDSGSGGNISLTGLPAGNVSIRAALPSAVTLTVGSSVSFSGSFSITGGSMGAGVFRMGIMDYSTLGTLTGTAWSTSATAPGYWYGPSTASTQQSNPGGGTDIVRKPSSAGNAWFSGSGGAGVGTTPANPNNIDASGLGTYTFNITLQDTLGGMDITYSLLGNNSPIYTASGTVLDTSGTVPTTFNAVGFFANGSDSALTSGVNFTGLTETFIPVPTPEPATYAMFGSGLAMLGLIRRFKK